MDFGILSVASLEGILSGLDGFNAAALAEASALSAQAASLAPPGNESASAAATANVLGQVAEIQTVCEASSANVMAYLTLSQENAAATVATDAVSAIAFAV